MVHKWLVRGIWRQVCRQRGKCIWSKKAQNNPKKRRVETSALMMGQKLSKIKENYFTSWPVRVYVRSPYIR